MAGRNEIVIAASGEAAQVAAPGSAAAALAKNEQEKMSRRAVLAKVGLRFGAAVIAAMSVDDLTRKVTETIARGNRDNAVAQQVANEFKNAGVAFADTTNASGFPCEYCVPAKVRGLDICYQAWLTCVNNTDPRWVSRLCDEPNNVCVSGVRLAYTACCKLGCDC